MLIRNKSLIAIILKISVISFLLSPSCLSEKKVKVCYMPIDSVRMIVTDLYLLEGIASLNDSTMGDVGLFYEQYFITNGFDEQRFDSSLKFYYRENPEEIVEEFNEQIVNHLIELSDSLKLL